MSDITPPLIAEYREKLARGDGTPRASATVVRYLAALSHAFSMAVRAWQWVEANLVLKVSRPKEPRGRVRYLTDEERERLLAACKASRNRSLYTIVVLALSTGARKMELCRLTWPDVDLHRGVITLRHTKNGDTRVLPLTGLALELLRQRGTARRQDTQLVFPDPTGRQPGCIRTAYLNAVRQAELADFHFHDLRHSAASYLAMHGAGLAKIADILGHRSLALARRYTHLTEQHNAKVLGTMTTALFGARSSRSARL